MGREGYEVNAIASYSQLQEGCARLPSLSAHASLAMGFSGHGGMPMQGFGQDHVTQLQQADGLRNAGMDLDMDWLGALRLNAPAITRSAVALPARRVVTGRERAAWMCKAVACMDLTTLSGDDTAARVARLCAKARQPLRPDLLEALGMEGLRVGAVCVYHEMIAPALEALEGTGIPVAAVSTGFPAGLSPMRLRIAEIEASVAAGAQEIDIVISRRRVLEGRWDALHDELRAFRAACGAAHMKAILATGELGGLHNVARAAMVAMMAGADFIKTSTGKEPVNATLPVTLVMLRMIRDYHERTGWRVGMKPAGGISKAGEALAYLAMLHEELGRDWMSPGLFRFGASSLLADIERQLEQHVSGRPSAAWRHGIG